MPQMAPLWWTTLSIMFITMLMIMAALSYFIYLSSPVKAKNKTITKTENNWLW
uniref:ATP synthase complex subunit 8 n=1 Tax=Nepa hoffmanni TaxID=796936 RepID=A0A0U2L5Y8_9HEMI|nr:ATP synthase F0 subunit 8 [Nepa hoffmanni]ALG35802.1 ATP synthase F0 subunit 8 [Nepa hoffmanni]